MAKFKLPPVPATLDPAQSLAPALDQARRFYSRMLANLARHRDAAQGDDVAVWQFLFDRVAHDAVWAVTELHRGVETKYFRQRFISERAYRHWSDASTRGECGRGVQHEHVVELREIKLQLADARTEEDFDEALSHAVACVVTNQDHDDLNRKAKHLRGWERYRKAEVAVWDRLEQRWHIAPVTSCDAAGGTNLGDAIEPSPTARDISGR